MYLHASNNLNYLSESPVAVFLMWPVSARRSSHVAVVESTLCIAVLLGGCGGQGCWVGPVGRPEVGWLLPWHQQVAAEDTHS